MPDSLVDHLSTTLGVTTTSISDTGDGRVHRALDVNIGGSTTLIAAVTIANGADVNAGSTTDAQATAGSTGTLSSKLRFVTSILGTISSTLTTLSAKFGSIGQQLMGASAPVAIASDQTRIPTKNTFGNMANANLAGTAAVSGGTAVKALGSATPTAARLGVYVQNNSALYSIWGFQQVAGSAPTINQATKFFRILPDDAFILYADGTGPIDIWLISSDAASTCPFVAWEMIA